MCWNSVKYYCCLLFEILRNSADYIFEEVCWLKACVCVRGARKPRVRSAMGLSEDQQEALAAVMGPLGTLLGGIMVR